MIAAGWAAGIVARLATSWVGPDEPWATVVVVAAVLGGAAMGVDAARRVEPLAPRERRDTVLGWIGVAGAGAAVACFALPFPWGVVAGVVVVGATVLALRRVPPASETA